MIPPSFFALDSFLMIRASTLVTSSQDVPLRSREVLSLSTHRQWKWRRLSKWKWTTIIITQTERSRSIFQVPLSTLLLLKTHETALVVGVFFFGQQDALLYIPLYWRKFSAILCFYFCRSTVFKFAGVKNVVFNLWNIGPGIGIAAACIHFGAEAYGQSMRKQPGQFDHEE